MEQIRTQWQNKVFLALIAGLVVRLATAPYLEHAATYETMEEIDLLFVSGYNPLELVAAKGTTYYLFHVPARVIYSVFNIFGIYSYSILLFSMKIPALLCDVVIFYVLYELTFAVTKDKNKSLSIGLIYFFNPYVIIFLVQGHADQLVSMFILLSFLFLIREKISYSAICLSLAAFVIFFPIFLLPCFLVYLWRLGRNKLSKFLGIFTVSFGILIIPYLSFFIPVYQSSPSAFLTLVGNWIGYGAGGPTHLPFMPDYSDFTWNFTGFLAKMNIWPFVDNLFGYSSLLILLSIVLVFTMKRILSSPLETSQMISLLNRFAIIMFALIIVCFPLAQGHYLTWVLPLLLLESIVFCSFPLYYVHAIWVSSVVMDPFIGFNWGWWFENSFGYWGTLNIVKGKWRPALNNRDLKSVLSVLIGLYYVLVIIMCSRPRKTITSNNTSNKQVV